MTKHKGKSHDYDAEASSVTSTEQDVKDNGSSQA